MATNGLRLLVARILGLHHGGRRKPFTIEARDGSLHHFDHKPKHRHNFKRWLRGILVPVALVALTVSVKAASPDGLPPPGPMIASNIVGSSTTLALASVQVLAPKANRKSWKCKANAANTAVVVLGAGSAATIASSLAQLSPGESYSETVVVSSVAINAISGTTGQGILCDQKVSP